jgi:hypothetical protein
VLLKLYEEYNLNEILDKFKELYDIARDQYEFLKRNGYESEDNGYTWEKVIELLGDDIWDEWDVLME